MAFDYGTRRMGVAVGHPHIGRGRGIGIVPIRDGHPDFVKVKKMVENWRPEVFVLGMPAARSSSDNRLKKQILRFGDALSREFEVNVSYVDETLSTEESNFRISQFRKRPSRAKKISQRNQISAEIILESYFAQSAD